MDLSEQPEIVQQVAGYALQGWELAKSWLLSPAAWSQFALLIVAYLVALYLSRKLKPVLTRLLTPAPDQDNVFATARRFVLIFLALLLPLLAYVLTGIGETLTRSIFGSGAVIAFGKRVFLFLAARILVEQIIQDGFLKLLGYKARLPRQFRIAPFFYVTGLVGFKNKGCFVRRFFCMAIDAVFHKAELAVFGPSWPRQAAR